MAEGFVANAKAMTSAKSPQEAAAIQTSYFKMVQEQVTGQATQLGESTAQLFKQAAAPFAEQAAAASAVMAPGKLAA
jgi:phasin family protein